MRTVSPLHGYKRYSVTITNIHYGYELTVPYYHNAYLIKTYNLNHLKYPESSLALVVRNPSEFIGVVLVFSF